MTEKNLSPYAETQRHSAILDSALATFARYGYRKTSMDEVARAAGITRQGLYFIFNSKEDLFRAAVTQALERDIADVEGVLTRADFPLKSALLEGFIKWTGRYIGPMAQDIEQVIADNPNLLGNMVTVMSERFHQLVMNAIAHTTSADLRQMSVPLAQTLISTSIGIKHQVESLEEYRERLDVAIKLLISDNGDR